MMRGQYDKPGEKVEPGVPAVFPPLTKADSRRRGPRGSIWPVGWCSPEHPLTAAWQVNRFWQQFFGTGLVKTSYDFGSQGEMPSHPELLDWLAVHFRDERLGREAARPADGHLGDVPATVASPAGAAPARSGESPLRPRAALPARRRADSRQRPVRQRPDQSRHGRATA